MYHLIHRGQETARWERPSDLPPLIYELLLSRGIGSETEARAFLGPDVSGLYDPFLLPGIDQAVKRIRAAKEAGETVCVWGDYDVDGICASSILTLYLRRLGIAVVTHIPHRHGEGYGLNEAGVRGEAGKASLLITVDCGISCRGEVELARGLGMDVIVTDHHRPGDNMPDGLVINPLLGGYPYDKLCGAGVAFKLVQALGGTNDAMEYVDLAALATVADLVPLTGENRVIVALGLKAINENPRLGVKTLIARSELTGKTISAGNVAFQLAPRLNAGGRLGDAARGLKLLTTDDPDEAQRLSDELNRENMLRRTQEADIVSQCAEMMETYSLADHKAIVLCGSGWNSGVIGLAASHLAQEYHYPVVLFAEEESALVGSCRSIPAVDIYACLCSVGHLLTRFGGHRQAAGLAMAKENLAGFVAGLDDYLTANTRPDDYVPELEYDLEWPLDRVDVNAVRLMDRLQPTGFGNPAPVFLTTARVDSARAVGREGAHLQLVLSQNGARVQGVSFGQGALAPKMAGTQRDMLYAPSVNEWRGQVSVQCEIRSMLDESVSDVTARFIDKYPRFLRAFLTQFLYNVDSNPIPGGADVIAADAVAECLAASPQGTAVIVTTEGGARDFLAFLKDNGLESRLDAVAGEWSGSRTGMNALCLCPVGPAGGRWSRMILWDTPKEAFASLPPADVFCAERRADCGWMGEIPDIDELRRAFMAARLFARGGVSRVSCEDIERDLSRSAGLFGGPKLQMALMVLEHMGLVEYDRTAARLSVPPARRMDPDEDILYQRLTAIHKGVI